MITGSVEVWARANRVLISFRPGTTAVLPVDTAREFLRALTAALDEAAIPHQPTATNH